jgi:hypothetical protein
MRDGVLVEKQAVCGRCRCFRMTRKEYSHAHARAVMPAAADQASPQVLDWLGVWRL